MTKKVSAFYFAFYLCYFLGISSRIYLGFVAKALAIYVGSDLNSFTLDE